MTRLSQREAAAAALAIEIADHAARSDIECYARFEQVRPENAARYFIYDLNPGSVASPADLAIARRAADYIRHRGNVFPWRMYEVPDRPGWVRFVDKEGRPLPPGGGT
ncbi:MAG: hypothetical protein AB7E55_00670 [Pigmentiphaga sp.]